MGGALSRLTSRRSTPFMQHAEQHLTESSSRRMHPIQVKDEVLVTRATQIMQDVEVSPPVPIKAAGPLPTSKSVNPYQDPEIAGRITTKAWAELIVRHRKDPDIDSVEKLAKEYKLDPVLVKSVLSQITVPVVFDRPGTKEKIGQWSQPNAEMKVPFLYFNDVMQEQSESKKR